MSTQQKRLFWDKKVSLSVLGLLGLIFSLSHAETDRMLKPKAMKADFEFLCENIVDIHPNIYANFPKEEFEAERQKLMEEFNTPMPIDGFYYRLVEFIVKVRDDHTYVSESDQIKKSWEYLPLYLKWFGNELRIIEAVGLHKNILKGAKIVSLGGLSPDQLLSKLRNYSFAENEYWVKEYYTNDILRKSLLNHITSTNWRDSVPIIVIPDTASEQIEFQLSLVPFGQRLKVEIQKTPYFEYRVLDDIQAIHFIFRNFFDDQVIRNLGEERATQYGLVKSGDFKDFLKDMFEKACAQKIQYIIIDLRQNTGGNSILGFQFLRYVDTERKSIKEFTYQQKLSKFMTYKYRLTPWGRFKAKILGMWPKNLGQLTPLEEEGLDQALNNENSVFYMPPIDERLRFKGKLICLTSNRTFSSAMDFATILSDNQLAVLAGEPTGGKPESFGDVLSRKLPHTGFRLGVSYKIFHRPDSTRKDEVSLFPDHEVVITYEDFKNGIDPVMKYTKEWIKTDRSKIR